MLTMRVAFACFELFASNSSAAIFAGRKFWGFPRFSGDCASGHKKSHIGTCSEQKSDITDTCSQMILQLHDVYDPNKVKILSQVFQGSCYVFSDLLFKLHYFGRSISR